jgi:hypothetical protein
MISVCVPVYNLDIRPLARQLAGQIRELREPVEALFFDDGSEESFRIMNREIRDLPGITYAEMAFNRGRSAIRNHLGRSASHPWLLFLDGDSLLFTYRFLQNYIDSIVEGNVICGGTIYYPVPPQDKSALLRWIYGTHREQLNAKKRNSRKKIAITSNNFLINKDLFLNTTFREAIRDYGHEDTVLGYDLYLKGITIKHIDNPVVHNGLETSGEFLRKTRLALKNLLFIQDHLIHDPRFIQSSGLLKKLKKLESLKMTRIVAGQFRIFEPFLSRNLTGNHPILILFDLYRLGYLCHCRRRK